MRTATTNLLVDSEAFRKLAQISPSMVFQTDPDGRTLYVSDRWQEITGHSANSWFDFGWLDFIVCDDRDRVLAEWQRAVADGEKFQSEFRMLHADGSTIWLWSQSMPIRNSDGTVLAYVGTCTDITPIRKTVDALQESEARYRSLVENAPVSIHEIDLDGNLISVNPAGLELAGGIDPNRILGRNYLKVTRQQENEVVEQALKRAFAGESCRFEFATQVGNEVRDFNSRLIPIKERDGSVCKVMGVTEDVTERNRIQLALKTINDELEARVAARTADLASANEQLSRTTDELKAIFRAFPDLQFRLDRDGTILGYVEGQANDLFLEPDEFLGRRMQDVLPGHVGRQFAKAIGEVGRKGSLVSIEYTLDFPDGQRAFEARLVPLGSDQLIVNARDVTVRYKLDATLRANEEKYRTIVDMSSEGIWTLDTQARVTFANESLARMLGYAVDEIIGSHFFDYLDLQGRVMAADLLGHRRDASVESRDFRLQKRDGGKLWAILSASAVFDADQRFQGTLIMLTDITERKHAEEALRRHEHLAAVGTLAAGISHEINNPLGALMIATKVARGAAGDPEKGGQLAECLELIASEAKRISEIVKNVQHFAKQGVLRKSSCNLVELAQKACQRTRDYAAAKGIELKLECPEIVPSIPANVLEIEQVLINLIHNAVEATDNGNPIVVRVCGKSDAVEIVVQDCGCGMTEEQLQRIFDPFYTTREYAGGTGLGLSIAHGIVARHGGMLEVQSEMGVGTSVTVVLPRPLGIV